MQGALGSRPFLLEDFPTVVVMRNATKTWKTRHRQTSLVRLHYTSEPIYKSMATCRTTRYCCNARFAIVKNRGFGITRVATT